MESPWFKLSEMLRKLFKTLDRFKSWLFEWIVFNRRVHMFKNMRVLMMAFIYMFIWINRIGMQVFCHFFPKNSDAKIAFSFFWITTAAILKFQDSWHHYFLRFCHSGLEWNTKEWCHIRTAATDWFKLIKMQRKWFSMNLGLKML